MGDSKRPRGVLRDLRPGLADGIATVEEPPSPTALEQIVVLLRAQTGNDFSLYKMSTVVSRIERRMGLKQLGNLSEYVGYLRENPREIEVLFKELLIGVTSFFRDPEVWDRLKEEVMPELIASRAAGGVLRAWVPGCSTGEEAYSLAIVFKEAVERQMPVRPLRLQIFATDLDNDAIDKARQGLYPRNIADNVSSERLRRFFSKEDCGYRVGKEIRGMVMFARQNLIMDPPFTRLDILSCRNVLIYLSGELQKSLIPIFHYSLNPGGFLFCGTAETAGRFPRLFAPVDGPSRIYRKLDEPAAVPPNLASWRSPGGNKDRLAEERPTPPLGVQVLVDRVIIAQFSPVAVLCTTKGDVLYVSRRADEYFEPTSEKANLNLFAMARKGLRVELSRALAATLRGPKALITRCLNLAAHGGSLVVNLTVQRLEWPSDLRGMVLVTLEEVEKLPPPHAAPHDALSDMRRVGLEEAQSTNEQLESINEELTTSQKEMQSLNEDLQTVNCELRSKVDALSRSNNDMKNMLDSTDIATLFLDNLLRVRRFTAPTAKIIRLIPADAGRPITDIASDLEYPELLDDTQEVMDRLVFKERQVSTRDGRRFEVRVMPYRTLENVIDGVVITFRDASSVDQLENALAEQLAKGRHCAGQLSALLDGMGEGFFEIDRQTVILELNRTAERLAEKKRTNVLGKRIVGAFPRLSGSALAKQLEQAFDHPWPAPFEVQAELSPGVHCKFRGVPQGSKRKAEGMHIFFERLPVAPAPL